MMADTYRRIFGRGPAPAPAEPPAALVWPHFARGLERRLAILGYSRTFRRALLPAIKAELELSGVQFSEPRPGSADRSH